MQKFAILTSLLALTACGGGHHGGGAANTDSMIDAQIAAQASNEKITSMKSFIIVGGNNPTVNANSRVASTGVQLSDGGILYDLSNIRFHTTTFTSDYLDPDDGADIKFETDENGKIVKISIVGPEQFGTGLIANRTSDESNTFHGAGSFHDMHDADSLYEFEFDTKPITYGNKVEGGLSYSDFGSMLLAAQDNEGNNESIEDAKPEAGEYFAGGYQIKLIKPSDVAAMIEKPSFTGHAEGAVIRGYDTDAGQVKMALLSNQDSNATLKFDENTAKYVLNAQFSNWYDVAASMGNDGKLDGIKFTNYTGQPGFKFNDETGGSYVAKPSTPNPDYEDHIIREGFIEYYGDNNNPSEAVGVIRYAADHSDHTIGSVQEGNERQEVLDFKMAFGVNKD